MKQLNLLFKINNAITQKDVKKFNRIIDSYPVTDITDVLNIIFFDDVVDFLISCNNKEIYKLFPYLSKNLQDYLLKNLNKKELNNLFKKLPHDMRADLYNRLDKTDRNYLIKILDEKIKNDILQLTSFPEGSVGSVTTSDFLYIDKNMTVEKSLDYIRKNAQNTETIYTIYVLNEEQHLIGTISLRDLVMAKPDSLINDIMITKPIYVKAQWAANEASILISRYDLLSIPVVDNENKMIGIVTVDDAMDIEKNIDTAKLTSFGSSNDIDLRTSSFFKMFSVRAFWLIFLTIFGIFTSAYVETKENIIKQVVILSAFMAPIIDMGGNTGSQAATLVIRSMALGEIRMNWKDLWFTIKKELLVVMCLSIVVSLMEVSFAYLHNSVNAKIMNVIGLSMFLCTFLGGVIGALLPFLAKLIKADPATLSSPFLTSIMDFIGVIIYFALAYHYLAI